MSYPEKSYYDTLGVPRNATDSQIKSAYRSQMKFFHPDVFHGNPEVANAKSLELNEAYSVLINHEKREKYDFWLRARDYAREQASSQCASEKRQSAEQQKSPEPDPAPEAESGTEHDPPETDGSNTENDNHAAGSSPQSSSSHRSRRLNVALSAVCAVLFVCVGLLGYHSYNMSETVNSLTAENSDLKETINTLNRRNTNLANSRNKLSKMSIELEELSENMKRQLLCIGFIVDDSPYYHRYDCSIYTSSDTFWAHNIEYCQYYGYEKCPLCWR